MNFVKHKKLKKFNPYDDILKFLQDLLSLTAEKIFNLWRFAFSFAVPDTQSFMLLFMMPSRVPTRKMKR